MTAGRKNPCLTFQSLLQTLCTGCQFVAVVVLPAVVPCGGRQGQVQVNHGQVIHSNLGKEEKSMPARGEWKVTTQNHVPAPSTFSGKSGAVGLTLLCMWCVLVCLSVGRKRREAFAFCSFVCSNLIPSQFWGNWFALANSFLLPLW